MLERWLAFGVLVGLLLVFASWSNEDEASDRAEARPADGLPPEMPEEDEPRPEPKRPRGDHDRERARGLVGGILGDRDDD